MYDSTCRRRLLYIFELKYWLEWYVDHGVQVTFLEGYEEDEGYEAK
jgi:hypothetical protein